MKHTLETANLRSAISTTAAEAAFTARERVHRQVNYARLDGIEAGRHRAEDAAR